MTGELRKTDRRVSPAVVEYSIGAFERMQATIAEQAREIERLTSCQRFESLYREAERELAALKAQPSGVVLPEPVTAFPFDDAVDGEHSDYGSGWFFTDNCQAEFFKADDVRALFARLNSSTVSAGEPCDSCEPAGVFATDGAGPFDCPDCGKKAAAQTAVKTAESRAALGVEGAAQVIAGGVNERAAFEDWYAARSFEGMAGNNRFERSGGEYWYIGTRKSWDAWQARAALTASAPNHSEQVREIESVQKVIVYLSDSLHQASNGIIPCGEDAIVECVSMLKHAIAAAPSAGSQKEQGE